MYFYLAVLLGIIVHLALKYKDALTKEVMFDWKRQLKFSGIGLLCTIALLLFRGEIAAIATSVKPEWGKTITGLVDYKLFWLLIAYFIDSIWKNIEKTGKEKLKDTDEGIISTPAKQEIPLSNIPNP